MGDSGLALALLAIILLGSRGKKLTAESFAGPFQRGVAPSYASYYYYATKPADELESGESLEESITSKGQVGQWLTINGRIPTPRGTTIPLPTVHVGRVAVDEMLQPLEKKDPQVFEDIGGRKSVNLRLRRLE